VNQTKNDGGRNVLKKMKSFCIVSCFPIKLNTRRGLDWKKNIPLEVKPKKMTVENKPLILPREDCNRMSMENYFASRWISSGKQMRTYSQWAVKTAVIAGLVTLSCPWLVYRWILSTGQMIFWSGVRLAHQDGRTGVLIWLKGKSYLRGASLPGLVRTEKQKQY